MIRAEDLIAQVRIPLEENGGYIWGATGQLWTQTKQDAATREMTIKYGQRWVGHHVWDCSGLFVWAYKRLGESIYHGSDTIWRKYCSAKGELKDGTRADGQPIKRGTAVFLYRDSDKKRHHIGLYVGDGQVIEAKGTINGVTTSRLDHWDEWGELSAVDYSKTEGDHLMQILRKGSTGEAVRNLQEMLNDMGYSCGEADGVYGKKTVEAVRRFQEDHGLDPDGIAGEKTQEAIAASADKPSTPGLPEDDDEYEDPVSPVPLTYTQAVAIRDELKRALKIIEEAIE